MEREGVKMIIKANIGHSGRRRIKIEGSWNAEEISRIIEKISQVVNCEVKQ